MFSTITIVTTTPFIFDIWYIEMLSDNRVHFRNGNKKITFGDTVKYKVPGVFHYSPVICNISHYNLKSRRVTVKHYINRLSVSSRRIF